MIALILLVFVLTLLIYYTSSKNKIRAITEARTNYAALLEREVIYYRNLEPGKKLAFERKLIDFLNYVHIEGVGTDITDLDRIFIASSAIIPVFEFEGWRYKNLTNVILYPDTFDESFQFEGEKRNIWGMVGSGYMNGQMILSRASLHRGFSSSSGKENVGIHEFVHLLDKSDGMTDGIPEMFLEHNYALPWLKMMHQEMKLIQDGKSDINPYALTSEAEFLAVASEYLFSKPEQFQSKHPELYKLMSEVFGLRARP